MRHAGKLQDRSFYSLYSSYSSHYSFSSCNVSRSPVYTRMHTGMHESEFRKFYEEHLDRIYRYIYYRVGGQKETAEDLTSEVFMSALEHMETLDATRHPGAWLFTAARNRLKNYYRDRKPTIDLDDIAPMAFGHDGRVLSERANDDRRLLEALSRLPAEQRRILEFKYLEGVPYAQIAAMLGKTAGTVRVEAHRAKRALKLLLKSL